MPPHTFVLSGFVALAQASFMDVLKKIGPQIWPPNVGRQHKKDILG